MCASLGSAWSIAVKDWTRFVRQPFLMIISVVIPLVFIFFYSIIVPCSATAPVTIADEDNSPESAALIQQMRGIRSAEAPYYEIVTTDPVTARHAFANQSSLAMVAIPNGFGNAVEAGNARVQLHLNNINSDYSKNLRLRLDLAVKNLNAELTHPIAKVLVVGFGFNPVGSVWEMAAIMAVTTVMGAGIGAAAGVASKKTLATSSSLITLAVLFFMVCGNEESLRGLAWSQPTNSLWGLSRALPPTYSFLAARSIFLTGDSTDLARNLAIVLVSAVAVLVLASWLLKHAYTQLAGGNA